MCADRLIVLWTVTKLTVKMVASSLYFVCKHRDGAPARLWQCPRNELLCVHWPFSPGDNFLILGSISSLISRCAALLAKGTGSMSANGLEAAQSYDVGLHTCTWTDGAAHVWGRQPVRSLQEWQGSDVLIEQQGWLQAMLLLCWLLLLLLLPYLTT